MRTTIKVSISTLATLALAAGIVACSDARATESSKADELKRDLELASATTMKLAGPAVNPSLLNAMETQPTSASAPATTVKRATGPRALRSKAPTVRAVPVDEADIVESGEAEVASAPAPDISEPVAVAPRPSMGEVVATSLPAGDYGTGSGGGGGGIFGDGGGRGRVVIRGGGVDGDNCDLHRRPRGTTTRGPIYYPAVPVARQPAGTRPSFGRGISLGGRNPGDNARRTPTASVPASQSPRTRPGPSRRGL